MSDRWFLRLVRLLPATFRREFGEGMLEAFRREREQRDLTTRSRRWAFWMETTRDIVSTAGVAWWDVLGSTVRGGRSGGAWRETMGTIRQDVSLAIRTFRRQPGPTVVILLTLAAGIGANTTVFSMVNALLLRPLPIGNAEQVVDIWADNAGNNSFSGFSYPNYSDFRDRNTVLTGLAAFRPSTLTLGEDDSDDQARVQFSSANYFDVLQIRMSRGRSFQPREGERGGANAVAVISFAFWQRRFGGGTEAVGSTLRIGGTVVTVIGIAPSGFGGTFIGFPVDMWVPLTLSEVVLPATDLDDRGDESLEFIGRRQADVSVSQTQAAFSVLAQQLERDYPVINRGRGAGVTHTTGIDHSMHRGVVGFLVVVVGVTGIVLLITCLNVGSVLLARATARRKEMATRLALGARPRRLARQLMTETLVLFALGGVGGVLLARGMNGLLVNSMAALPFPLHFDLGLDWSVIAFTAGVALIAALLAGPFPAVEGARQDPMSLLRVRSEDGGGAAHTLRNLFVVTQIAGAVVLLVGAGLFLRSLQNGLRLDPGFDADRLAVTTVTLPETDYDAERGQVLLDQLVTRVRELPLVEAAALTLRRPVDVQRNPLEVEVPGIDPPVGQDALLVEASRVGVEYFETVGIPLVAGRVFRPSEGGEGGRVAVINQTMADRYFPEGEVIGRGFVAGGERRTIIGVARDARYMVQDDAPLAMVYLPQRERFTAQTQLVVRSPAAPGELQREIQTVLHTLDGTLARITVRSVREMINLSLVPQRLAAVITAGLGGFGLLLATLGVYGVLAHAVARRTREIGIRMALGGNATRVTGLVIRSGMVLVGTGLIIGLAAAFVLGPLAGSFLVGVDPVDPVTVVAVVGSLAVTAFIACAIPAWRVSRVEPNLALRED